MCNEWLIENCMWTIRSQGSSVSMDWMTRRLRFNPRQRVFPLTSVSRLAVVPTQPPVQWVPGVLSPGVKCGQGMMLTTHPHLVSRSWMSRHYTSSPPCASVGVLWGCFTYANRQTSGYIILHYFLKTSQKSGNSQQARWQCLKIHVFTSVLVYSQKYYCVNICVSQHRTIALVQAHKVIHSSLQLPASLSGQCATT
jgi:hypothetical protein